MTARHVGPRLRLGAVVLVVAASLAAPLLAAPPLAGAASTPPAPTDEIGGISCVPGACVALGGHQRAGAVDPSPMAWTLRAGSWDATAISTPASTIPFYSSVSCPQLGACMAVGTSSTGGSATAFAERLVAGVAHATALPAGVSLLSSVSCVTTTWCMAVGQTLSTPSTGLALVWDGTTWSSIDAGTLTTSWGLAGVDCLSTTSCVAVGSANATPIAESWDGSAWTATLAPTPPISEDYRWLDRVSCTSSSTCLAVGQTYGCCGSGGGMAMAWNGTTWSVVTMSAPLYGAGLTGVSCTSDDACLVVGTVSPSDVDRFPPYAVVARWDGTSLTTLPGAAVGAQSGLDAVDCTRASWCAAVGSLSVRASGPVLPLIERWDGATLKRMFAPA